MNKPQALQNRLNEIGRSLARDDQALALIGVGSVGTELDRLDEYSDLDFFVIVNEGYKNAFIENLQWLSNITPIAYYFMNTVDGYKLLFEDGIFCEFAVFELHELADIPFSAARVVWRADSSEAALTQALNGAQRALPQPAIKTKDWLVGEALTNLYVGLGHYRRGEILSAARFIQGYAIDRILELAVYIEPEQPAYQDQFAFERRFEQRFPRVAQLLPGFMQGYAHSPESAQAILQFLEEHFEVNPALKSQINTLIRG